MVWHLRFSIGNARHLGDRQAVIAAPRPVGMLTVGNVSNDRVRPSTKRALRSRRRNRTRLFNADVARFQPGVEDRHLIW
jgi:hypothetical protein